MITLLLATTCSHSVIALGYSTVYTPRDSTFKNLILPTPWTCVFRRILTTKWNYYSKNSKQSVFVLEKWPLLIWRYEQYVYVLLKALSPNQAVPWLWQLVTGLSPWMTAFDPKRSHLRFVVEKFALGQGFCPGNLAFLCQYHSTNAQY